MDFELLFKAVEDEDFITTEEVLEDILEDKDSIKRKPTINTLWMLNRILNSPKLDESEKYISLMREVSNDKNIDESLRNEAKEYWDYQNR